MRDYNDFPILTEEEYKQINNIYNQTSQTKSEDIENIISQLQFCINSLSKIEKRSSKNLKEQILSSKNDLNSLLSAIKVLYPNLTNNNQQQFTDNIFLTLHSITSIINCFENLIDGENKLYYKKSFKKSKNKLLITLTNILLAFSKLNTTFSS